MIEPEVTTYTKEFADIWIRKGFPLEALDALEPFLTNSEYKYIRQETIKRRGVPDD